MSTFQMSAVLFILFLVSFGVKCAKILGVFAAPCISHQAVFRQYSEELLRKGHELVTITPLPNFQNKTVKNIMEIDVFDVTYDTWKNMTKKISAHRKQNLNQQKKHMAAIGLDICMAQITSKGVQELIDNKINKFDLVLVESGSNLLFMLSHIFKAPIIVISSLGASLNNFELFGVTEHPLLYPPGMCRRFYNLNMWEKINEVYDYFWYKIIVMNLVSAESSTLKILYGKDTPTIYELANNLDQLYLNTYRIWEGNRPIPLSTVYLGGMHQVPVKELPQDLQSYLDASVNGVIYMSFGTNISPSLFAPEKIQLFINVFSKFSYDILWNWDQDNILGCSENIKVTRWVPQADLLHHPKIKLFITQGGLQSTDESITAGVPLIGIPMLGDQWHTTEKYVQHKIGIKLDFDTLTEEQLKESIETVIGNESYRENVAKLRTILQDQPQTSRERAVWWTEYVLRYGGAKHLRGPAANMSWTEYMELQILLASLLGLLVIIATLIHITCMFVTYAHKFIILKLNVLH